MTADKFRKLARESNELAAQADSRGDAQSAEVNQLVADGCRKHAQVLRDIFGDDKR